MLHACVEGLGSLVGHLPLEPLADPSSSPSAALCSCLLPFALSPGFPPRRSPLPAPWGCRAPPPRVTPDVSPTGSPSERLQPPWSTCFGRAVSRGTSGLNSVQTPAHAASRLRCLQFLLLLSVHGWEQALGLKPAALPRVQLRFHIRETFSFPLLPRVL